MRNLLTRAYARVMAIDTENAAIVIGWVGGLVVAFAEWPRLMEFWL